MLSKFVKCGLILLLIIISISIFLGIAFKDGFLISSESHDEIYGEASINDNLKITVIKSSSNFSVPDSYRIYLIGRGDTPNKNNIIASYNHGIPSSQKNKTGIRVKSKRDIITVIYPKSEDFTEIKTELVIKNKTYKLRKEFYE